MHIHILGICGTFMGGIAAIAQAMGHKVTGSDQNVYPPMSTQLQSLGITLTEGYDAAQFSPAPDLVIIGNALSRGNPAVEYVLNSKLAYTSGPEWLLREVLQERWVLAVSGTHGKTTTTGMLTWILEDCGYEPGFLIGGVPGNFGVSARLGTSAFFVIEADEYDSAFFDKRSKFVHYRPNTLILNNLEYDHADIFANLDAIQTQFHHLLRMVPGNGLVLSPADEPAIDAVLERGCWSEQQRIGSDWRAELLTPEGSQFAVYFNDEHLGDVTWGLIGQHNVNNALMAIAAARHAGVDPTHAIAALGRFKNVKRRLELLAQVNDIKVYDDFAHHPTAIATTLAGLRAKVGNERIIAVLEPRSNTMKMGVHKDTLADSWQDADRVLLYQPQEQQWSFSPSQAAAPTPVTKTEDIDILIEAIVEQSQPGDHILIMSNGGFGGLHQKLIQALG